MKILVTGGSGFIGTHLIERLLDDSKNVVVSADNLSAGLKKNAEKFNNNKNYEFVNLDITDEKGLNALFARAKFDVVYHLAANSNVMLGGTNPRIDRKNTLETTLTLLECMAVNGVKNLFFSSTSSVYGNHSDEFLHETTGGLKPISYYGGFKLASEAAISAFAYMNDLNCLVFRFPNVIGGGLTHGVIFDFVNRLIANSAKLDVLGNGTQNKEYIFIDDLIDAIFFAVEKVGFAPGFELLNVGSNSTTSVKQIAEMTVAAMKLKDTQISYSEGDVGWKGDVNRFKFDTKKIAKLGWTAKFTSDQAVTKTIETFLAEIGYK